MSIPILKSKDVVLYHEFTSPKKLGNLNAKRINEGKHALKLSQHLGYISRESAVDSKKGYYQEYDRDTMNEVIKDKGYLTREEAIENHPEFFANEDKDDYIVGIVNGECFKQSEQAEALAPMIEHLDKLEESGRFNIQSSVISFPPEYSKALSGQIEQEKLLKYISNMYTNVLCKHEGYQKDNLNIVICAHTNKDHFHLHIDFWEKEEHRPFRKIDVKTFDILKEQTARIMNEQTRPDDYQELLLLNNRYEKLAEPIKAPKELISRLVAQDNKYFNRIKDKQLKQDIEDFAEEIFKKNGYDLQLEELYRKNIEVYDIENVKQIMLDKYNRKINQIANNIVRQANEVRESLEKELGVETNTLECVDSNTLEKSFEVGEDLIDTTYKENTRKRLEKYMCVETNTLEKHQLEKIYRDYGNNYSLLNGLDNNKLFINNMDIYLTDNINYKLVFTDNGVDINTIGTFDMLEYNHALYYKHDINRSFNIQHGTYKGIDLKNQELDASTRKDLLLASKTHYKFNEYVYKGDLIQNQYQPDTFFVKNQNGVSLRLDNDKFVIDESYCFGDYDKDLLEDMLYNVNAYETTLENTLFNQINELNKNVLIPTPQQHIFERFNNNYTFIDKLKSGELVHSFNSPTSFYAYGINLELTKEGLIYLPNQEYKPEVDQIILDINKTQNYLEDKRVGINTQQLPDNFYDNWELSNKVLFGQLTQSTTRPELFYANNVDCGVLELKQNGLFVNKELSSPNLSSDDIEYLESISFDVNTRQQQNDNYKQARAEFDNFNYNEALAMGLATNLIQSFLESNKIAEDNVNNNINSYLNRDAWNLNWYFNGIDNNVIMDSCRRDLKRDLEHKM